MPVFTYECMNKQGELITGEITADTVASAAERLRSSGYAVLELAEYREKVRSSFLSNEPKVKLSDITLFSRQLAAMLGAGIPVTRSLHTLSKQCENPTLKNALEHIARNIEGGMSLTDAFSAYPTIFPKIYISMLKAGEVGGTLEKTLLRLSDQLQKEKQVKDNIKSAMSYPKMICIFTVLIFLAMLIFMVPVFKGFIPSSAEIPAITQFIFNLSDSIRTRWYAWVLVAGVIVGGMILFFKSEAGHDLWEQYKLKIPILGPIMVKSVIARFTRTLATLLDGGIPVVQALESAGPTSGSDVLAETVKLATKRIEEGKTIASTLEESPVFPPMVTHMIAVGEDSGTLPTLLDKVAEFYEEEVDVATKSLQAVIQPVLLIFIGTLIGGMLISLYLPMLTVVANTR
ncbi:type II secretion system F family protein [Thermoclostridium caenicola]|uniref:Type IV pilus assembly protein PilC n=1 Tax=Thermoclostridium caenicola TaxID=659425 RepID=A0A1M6GL95_9FIRM|nr:type II secretion system F family protein [Thermoclostridium caenicola]SHJ10728.1 type IV pilus assembly protein PilC [Thermoclostridium caenicola]